MASESQKRESVSKIRFSFFYPSTDTDNHSSEMHTLKKFDRLLSARLPFLPASSVRSYRLTSSNQNHWGITIRRMTVDVPTLTEKRSGQRELEWCTLLCERYTVDERLHSPHVLLVGGSDLLALRPLTANAGTQLDIWPHFDVPCQLFAGRSLAPTLSTRNTNVTLRFSRTPESQTFDWVVWLDGHEAYLPKSFRCKRVDTDERTWQDFADRLGLIDERH